ncbi:hypothetical protein ON010_g19180 [Phytophthora cinnamomi]|nr:hypothetical protein ON010_g19180 [Phytophthora cinnamomi]
MLPVRFSARLSVHSPIRLELPTHQLKHQPAMKIIQTAIIAVAAAICSAGVSMAWDPAQLRSGRTNSAQRGQFHEPADRTSTSHFYRGGRRE